MDGVLSDFERGAKEANLHPSKFKMQVGAYRYLQPYAKALEAVDFLSQQAFELFVATKLPKDNFSAASEKLSWIEEHFPVLNDRVIITPDKGALGRGTDVLIDDHPEWANAKEFGGHVVTFKSWPQALTDLGKIHFLELPAWAKYRAGFGS